MGAAGVALAAGDRGQHGDTVAQLEVRNILAELDDLAGIFMAELHILAEIEHGAAGEREVGAADAAARDLDHDVVRAGLRIGQGLDGDGLALAGIDGGFHGRFSTRSNRCT